MRVVINRTDAIGDTILTTPMAQAIKEKDRNSKVIFWVSSRVEDLLKDHPYIDDYWVFDEKTPLLVLIKKLKEFRATHFFHVGGSFWPALAAMLANIPFRGGVLSRWPSFLLLNQGIRQKRSLGAKHEVAFNLELLSSLNIESDLIRPTLTVNSLGEKFEREIIVVHPGMTGHTLNWPTSFYRELIKGIEKCYPKRFEFLISYTPSDVRYLEGLKEMSVPVVFFNGKEKGLSHYLGVLSKASLFIGPSTGPTHMANAIDVKQIAIYSPILAQAPWRWAPFVVDEQRTRIFSPRVSCPEKTKCIGAECPDYFCMEKIRVAEVLKAVQELL